MVNTRPNIWQLQSRHDIAALQASLSHSDPDVRRRAAQALQTLDVVQAVPALKTALQQETDTQTRDVLNNVLHVLDHRTDIERLIHEKDTNRLIQVLRSRRPENVIAAARALGKIGDRMAVEPLVILFHDPASTPRVRLAAADALLELKSAPAVVTLLGALRRDSAQVRCNAAAVLGQIQATWAVEPLVGALEDPHQAVRRSAAVALRRIGTPEAVAALRAHFSSRKEEAAQPSKRDTLILNAAPVDTSPETPHAISDQTVHEPVPITRPPSLPEEHAEPPRAESVPLLVTPPHPLPELLPPEEHPSRLIRPVHKLISFFKRSDS